MTILTGVRIIEFAGLGPAPFCGMLMADLGADVILIERRQHVGARPAAIFNRGKRSIQLDLKNRKHVEVARRLVLGADALIEGFRPGVMERLGLGPETLRNDNNTLVYGRLTGWGQTGPLASAAGHDINYVGLSGAGWYAGQAGDPPTPPPTLVGDIGGGALYLAIGLLAGLIKARDFGTGSVVDTAIVDGAAHMTSLLSALSASGGLPEARGQSMLDGAPFYNVYQTKDGSYLSVGPLEPKFYAILVDELGLADDPAFASQFDQSMWPAAKSRLEAVFKSAPLEHWLERLEGTDACVAPVLSPKGAADHRHIAARSIYVDVDGVQQARAAPRFDGQCPTEPAPPPEPGAQTSEILQELGLSSDHLWTET